MAGHWSWLRDMKATVWNSKHMKCDIFLYINCTNKYPEDKRAAMDFLLLALTEGFYKHAGSTTGKHRAEIKVNVNPTLQII